MSRMLCFVEGQITLGGFGLVDSGAGLFEDWWVDLFTNDIALAPTQSLEDFDIPTFSGYERFSLERADFVGLEFVAPDTSRTKRLIFPEYSCTGGAPQTVYGWVMSGKTSETAYFGQRLSVPRVMSHGAVLKLAPFQISVGTLN